MKSTINSYFAVLLVTIAGAGATSIILHTANSAALGTTIVSSQGDYTALRQLLLK